MSTTDISRFLFQPRKRYSSVRMQQGRVILDSDWNESERIDDEEARRTLIDVICSKGTSNNGFQVGNVQGADVAIPGPSTVASYNFDFENGSFYVGGLRFESETDGTPETFLSQGDWLQIDASADNLPLRPVDLPAGGSRFDLIYLRGWEQCVTAVEDSELREMALGGPDTSVRVRRMRRVEVFTDAPGTCAEAFNALKQRLTAPVVPDTGAPHEFDLQSYELKSKARLTVAPNPADITEDPCKPAVPGGYLGADNQTIRVQLTAADRFIWGYDNASPLYRVQVENIPDDPGGVGIRRKIKFLSLPHDQEAQPLAGQAVEIIPWGALLPNLEKVAEFQGKLFTVETSFDPEDGSLTITQPVPQEWIQWLADHHQFWSGRDETERKQYLYLRLWTGGSGDAANPDLQFTPNTPVPLEGVGLSVRFSDFGLPGDFWIIAARPNTPDLVAPWELLDSAPPAGPRYFFAPLALVSWSLDGKKNLQAGVHDCRERFRSLCNLRGCCTVTVGDGVSSHGDFNSIEEAVAFLPDGGGEVCLLPGQHRANVTINGRSNITIKGCGKQTVVVPRESNLDAPIFQALDSQGITLREMELVTLAGTAIAMAGSQTGALSEIKIVNNRILASEQAIEVRQGVDIHIQNNHIRILDKDGAGVAVRILAEDSVIEGNNIGVVPAEQTPPPDGQGANPNPINPCADPEVLYLKPGVLRSLVDRIFGIFVQAAPVAPFKALGGIQIAAASERVKVLDNDILGGAGNGITLGGSLDSAPAEKEDQQTIETTTLGIQGSLFTNGKPVAGATLIFTSPGAIHNAVSGGNGYYSADVAPGKYTVAITSPLDLKIESIALKDNGELGLFHDITLAQVDTEADETLSFLYEIEIDSNEISRMGLSGIGFPIVPTVILGPAPAATAAATTNSTQAALLGQIGNPIVTLGIHRNYIHDCLQNPFDSALLAEALNRGFGGISLGSCENVTIGENRIERNGLSHVNPVCGIFIRDGVRLDIYHNHILNNGPLADDLNQDLERGFRGGIALLAVIADTGAGAGLSDAGLHAARVHSNIVHQPAGQALRLVSLGLVSICNNRFVTDISGPESGDRLAGALMVMNVAGGGSLTDDLILFNSNQSRLGQQAESLSSQAIICDGDIGFNGNQSVALAEGQIVQGNSTEFTNTGLIGRTIRAIDNRFIETPGTLTPLFRLSLSTVSMLFNNTSYNQADHCIVFNNQDQTKPPIAIGNQVVNAESCDTFGANAAPIMAAFNLGGPINRG
jgi:hypothetical protein